MALTYYHLLLFVSTLNGRRGSGDEEEIPYIIPPLTEITWPVMYEASSEQRNRTTFATSSGFPILPMGMMFLIISIGRVLDHVGLDEARAPPRSPGSLFSRSPTRWSGSLR